MEIRQIQSEYISQLFSAQNSPVLLHSKWRDIHGDGMSYFEVTDDKEVVAFFSVFTYKKFGKSFLITPPGFPYCGFKVVNPTKDREESIRFYQNLSIAVEAFITRKFSRYAIDLSFPPELSFQDPFLKSGYSIKQRITYLLDLSNSTETLVKGLSGNRKRNVKSMEKGYNVIVRPLNPEVLKLLKFTVQKSDNNKMMPVYEKLVADEPLDFVNGITVSKGDDLMSGGLFISDSEVCYYFAGGFDPSIKDHHAGTICLWTAILEAKLNGKAEFNFCGSTIPSIENYFKSFGPNRTPYLRIKKGMTMIDSIKKVKGKLFK